MLEILYLYKLLILFFSEKVSKFSKDPKFNDNVYLTFRNNQYGCIGMGYVGTVCSQDITARSNLCEYLNDEMTAGHVSVSKCLCDDDNLR